MEGGEGGRSVEAVLELRICMAWLWGEWRSERSLILNSVSWVMAQSISKTSFSRTAFWNTVVRFAIKWLGGGLERVVGLLVGELVLVELVLELIELVAFSLTFRSRTWLVGMPQVMQPCWKQGEFLRQVL